MKSLMDLDKIGNGPSSSHTMGPKNASIIFMNENPLCNRFEVTLFGSLALTGKGHLTDYVILNTLPNTKVIFDYKTEVCHPNTMEFRGYIDDKLVASKTFFSIGGGALAVDGVSLTTAKDIYNERNFLEICKFISDKNITLDEYVDFYEDINDYLENVLDTMITTLEKGLNTTTLIPGKLKLKRKAKMLLDDKNNILRDDNHKLMAYAYATAEENASGGVIVTAPTCGASGVLPAVIYYLKDKYNTSRKTIIKGLKIAGIIGNVVKQNGSISGAEAGCQAEIGTACSMAAAYACYIFGGDITRIERSAEIALEHHLGLTCDPVGGYVQIPCIERNAVAALRAIDAARLAMYLNDDDARISFDTVVSTMLETGASLPRELRETSQGGLATKVILGDKIED